MTKQEESQRTKELLAASLKKKMARKSLSKITVTELVKDCGLNRRTFYYHFKDIYDLAAWMLKTDTADFVELCSSTKTWEEGVRAVLYYIKDNKDICLYSMDELGRDILQQFFYRAVYEHVHKLLDEVRAGRYVDEKLMDFMVGYYTLSFAANVIGWISAGMKPSPEEIVSLMSLVIAGSVDKSMDNAVAASAR